MRLATWNVNSARARQPRLIDWLDQRHPDVACLQETKMGDAEFAEVFGDELSRRGYVAAHHGEGRWNGVAIVSRSGLEDVRRGLLDQPGFPEPEARAVAATCGGRRVWSVEARDGWAADDLSIALKQTRVTRRLRAPARGTAAR